MKNKGFTLVELLAAISILAILTVIAIPTLRAFQANNDKKTFENYGKSMVTSAKLYNDSYSEDLFGHLENGCQKVTLTEMINKKVAKDITLKDITCNKSGRDSYVLVWKYKDEYAYDSVVNCENSRGINQYVDKNEAIAESCISATGKPTITVNTITNESNTTKKKSVVINLNDEFGFTSNQEIEYAFSTINNANGTGVTGYKDYKYNNSYIKRKSGTVTLSTNSITIPNETTGTYYLYVKPVKVQNIINESITNIHKFGPYRFDHEPPACPTIKAYKADGSEVAKNTPAQISKFSIKYSADDLQNYEFQISYDNGSSWSTATTYGNDKKEYIPTQDGKIIIKTKAKDYANNSQSSWCTSNTFIRDTTPPTVPTVTGYKKNNATDITAKGSLPTHASNTWLSGWIFTQASGSTDENGVTYYYTTTGTTSNVTNQKASYRNVNAEGESTVKFKACDNAGNCSGWTSYIAKLDRTAPTCGTATGASTTWTKDNRTIKLACSETSGSGCAKESYNKTYNSGTVKTASDKIKDNAGNERTCTYNVYVDKDAPTCGKASGESTTWTNSSRTIKQPCSDSGSGCAQASYDKTYSSGTITTASITIKDNVGNTNTCTPSVYVDRDSPTAPTINGYKKTSSAGISYANGLSSYSFNTWYKGYVFATASGSTDSGSGVDGYYLTTSGQGSSDVTNSKQSTRNVNAEGTVTLKWKACDKAGNCSAEVTKYVKLDRTAPTCGTATGASTTWTNSNRTIKQACSDTYSDCAQESYDVEYKTTTKVGSITIKDNVGNSATCTPNVYVDKTAPTCGTATGTSTTWTNSSRTIKQACSDSHSECEQTSYEKTYSSGTITTATITIKDKAGNTNTCKPSVYVDTDPPTPPTINGYKKDDETNVSSASGLGSYSFNTWYSGYAFATASGSTDSGSGVEGYYLTTTGQGSSDVSNKKQSTRNVNVEGTVTLKWKACDKVGNCSSEETKKVKLDRTDPSATLKLESYHKADGYNSVYVLYSASISDSLSGTNKYCFSADEKCTPTKNADGKSSIPDKSDEKIKVADELDGTKHDIYVCLTDQAGNKKCYKKAYTVYLHCSETVSDTEETGAYYFVEEIEHNCKEKGGPGERHSWVYGTPRPDWRSLVYINRPWAMYRFYDFDCTCKYDKYKKDYCETTAKAQRLGAHKVSQGTWAHDHMTIFYNDTSKGSKSCMSYQNSNGKYGGQYRNQNVYVVCFESAMTEPMGPIAATHGYVFYNYDLGTGNSKGEDSEGRKAYYQLVDKQWYHTQRDRDKHVEKKSSNYGTDDEPNLKEANRACDHACGLTNNKDAG